MACEHDRGPCPQCTQLTRKLVDESNDLTRRIWANAKVRTYIDDGLIVLRVGKMRAHLTPEQSQAIVTGLTSELQNAPAGAS